MADDRKSSAEQKKLRQAEDGKKAMLEYEADAAATRAKTERLRALRLERDATAPPPAAPKKVSSKKKKAVATKVKPKALADWMSDRKKDGMRD